MKHQEAAECKLSANPFPGLPPELARIAHCLSAVHGVTLETVRGALQGYLISLPKGQRPRNQAYLEDRLMAAIAWARGYRWIAGGYVEAPTCVFLDEMEYLVDPQDFPRRRRCNDAPYSDRYATPGRYIAPRRHMVGPAVSSTVENWGMRIFQAAFGQPGVVPILYCLSDHARPERERTLLHWMTKFVDVADIACPVFLVNITAIEMRWGAFARMRRHGLHASEGFLPLDVVEDNSGMPVRVVALVWGHRDIVLESIPFSEVERWLK